MSRNCPQKWTLQESLVRCNAEEFLRHVIQYEKAVGEIPDVDLSGPGPRKDRESHSTLFSNATISVQRHNALSEAMKNIQF